MQVKPNSRLPTNRIKSPKNVLADDILKKRLEYEASFGIREFASEEQDTIKILSNNGDRYSVVVDPLDGSSLIDRHVLH